MNAFVLHPEILSVFHPCGYLFVPKTHCGHMHHNNRADTDLSGVNHPGPQILHIPPDIYLIHLLQSIHVHRLFKRNGAFNRLKLYTAIITHVQDAKIQLSPDNTFISHRFNISDIQSSFFLYDSLHVRSGVRYIKIII